jgi:predicted RNase H-like nuclease (RuvC/YqgF family)
MGIDLAPSAQHMQEYALVVINERGIIIDRREGVDWETVSRLLKKYKVDTIAVDNVFEIGESISEIKRRLGKVIDKVRLVEVTRVGDRYVKLAELAFREGILNERAHHLSPLQAAEVSALLALKGVGTAIIEPSTIRTAILISRGRSLGPGGMSQGRYNRSQRSAIKQVTSLILDELKKHVDGSDVECYVQRSKFGLERSVIILNTTPSHVKKLLRPFRDLIKKSGVNLRIIARIPAFDERKLDLNHREEKPIIVGLDPGIITGVTILDMHGNLLFVDSGLALDRMSIIRIVTKFGNPVVIASDVKRAPVVVEKIASILGCTVYTPPRDLSVEEKRRVVQENVVNFKDLVKNSHQRDAVAAALKAYFNFKNKFMQLEARAKELNLSRPQIEKAKALIVKGLTIKEALERVTLDDKPDKSLVTAQAEPEIQRLRSELSKLREKVEEQSKAIRDLEESRLNLLRQLKEKEAKIEELEEALIKAALRPPHVSQDEEAVKRRLEASAKTISELKARVEVMERDLEELKRLVRELARGNVVIVKEVRSITKRSLEEAVKYEVLGNGEIVLVQDPTSFNVEGIELLINMQPEAIITKVDKIPKETLEAFKENCIPVIDVEEVKVERASNFLYALSTIKKLIKAKREQLLAEKDRSLKEKLKDMLRKYREERARELEKLKQ